MKLDEFRIETYDERSALLHAIARVESEMPEWHKPALEAIAQRLARTQCQPGGCDLCSDEPTEDQS